MVSITLPAALDAVVRVLPELFLKGTLVLLAASALAFVFRRASASTRHLVWAAGVAGVLALPLCTFLPLRVAVLPAWVRGETARTFTVNRPAPLATTPAPDVAGATVKNDAPEAAAPTPPPARTWTADAPAPDGSRAWRTTNLPAAATWSDGGGVWRLTGGGWMRMVVALWLLGAALLVVRLLVGMTTVWWLARTGERVEDEAWTLPADRISRAFDAPSVRLIRTRWTEMPMTWGVLRPVVLLPAGADEWSLERREVVLRHELAHVARRDVLTLAVAQLACALHWFNPLSWIALRELRAEAEKCCDDWVLRAGTRASTYAGHLLEMVRVIGRARVPAALALPMAQRSTFEGRLLAILEPGVDRGLVRRGHGALTAAGLAALVLFVGALRPAEASTVAASGGGGDWGDARAGGTPAVLAPPSVRDVVLDDRAAPAAPAETPRAAARAVTPEVLATLPAGVAPVISALAGTTQAAVTQGQRAGAVSSLLDALRDPSVDVRRHVVRALGTLHDPRAVAALIHALQTDQDPEVRTTAAWALGQIDDRSAVPALAQAMANDHAVEVRRTAAWALGQLDDPSAVDALGRATSDADAEVRSTAVWALGQIRDRRALPVLTSTLHDGSVELRRQAAWALGQLGARESSPALVAALRDGDREVRSTAVWALGQIEPPDAVPALAGVLRDPDAQVRAQAAWALGQIENEASVAPLSAALQSDNEVEVRATAAWALGQISKASAVPALTAALGDRSARVRAQAAWALGQTRLERAPAPLLAALRDGDVGVRRTAAWAVGQIEDDPSAVAALRGAVHDGDAQVRRAAVRALAGAHDDAAASALGELLKDPDPELRAAAAAAIGGHVWVDPRPEPRPEPRPRPRPRPEP